MDLLNLLGKERRKEKKEEEEIKCIWKAPKSLNEANSESSFFRRKTKVKDSPKGKKSLMLDQHDFAIISSFSWDGLFIYGKF